MGLTRYGIKAIKGSSENIYGSDNRALFQPGGSSGKLFQINLEPFDLDSGDTGFSVDVRDGNNRSFWTDNPNLYFASVAGNTDDRFLVGSRFGFSAGEGNDIVEIHPNGFGPVALGPGDDTVIQKTGGSTSIVFGGSGNDLINDSDRFSTSPEVESVAPKGSYIRGDGFDYLGLIENGQDLKLVATVAKIDPLVGGNDTIYGNGGPDILLGDGGNDLIFGGDGDDYIEGGAGSDTVDGGAGNDTLRANYGPGVASDRHTMTGGPGSDLFVMELTEFPTITDWDNSEDRLNVLDWEVYSADQIAVRDLGGNALLVSPAVSEGKGSVTLLNTTSFDLSRLDFSQPPDIPGPTNGPIPNIDSVERVGTAGPDALSGNAGDDRLEGRGGDDTLAGNMGGDRLHGDGGDDLLLGRAGADIAWGGRDADTVRGGSHDDRLSGGAGDDVLKGNQGIDLLRGGGGRDVLHGGQGDDSAFGGRGDDLLSGGRGDDRVNGGTGRDTMSGDAGNDHLRGGAGDDVVYGDNGKDRATGGRGDDTIVAGDGDDWAAGGRGADRLIGGFGQDTIRGGAGNDSLDGSYGRDRLNGGSGQDVLRGGGRSDVLTGGSGADTLKGGRGNDLINGGAGDDLIGAAHGVNTVNGGSGADVFMLVPGDGLQVIVDFEQGLDKLKLVGDLTPDDLSFSGTDIARGDDIIARLVGFDAADLSVSDFVF